VFYWLLSHYTWIVCCILLAEHWHGLTSLFTMCRRRTLLIVLCASMLSNMHVCNCSLFHHAYL